MSLDKIKNLLDKNNFDFHFIESVDSTMSEVKKLIYNRNICLMANEQKKGFGRRGTTWESPKNNVYISILSKNILPIENHFLNNAFITNMICSVIEKHRENTLLSTDFEFIPKVEKKPQVKVEKKPENSEYLNVKVLEDLPTFTGMDAKNYTLKSGDIESIPIYNARMLSDAGKVKLVKGVKV